MQQQPVVSSTTPVVPAPSRAVYPNPSSETRWTDGIGRVWTRHVAPPRELHPNRIRTLLRRDDVPLVTWHAGDVVWFVGPADKQSAAARLRAEAAADVQGDVAASEWRAEDGSPLLLLERSC